MEKRNVMEEFAEVVRILRGENGCPWDREQTHESLGNALLEESYEAIDAIKSGDMENLREELGDILLHVVMHAAIAEEGGEFTLEQVIDGIKEKMIRRHPHVFGTEQISSAEGIVERWEELKREEKKEEKASDGLKRVAKALPAMIRAEKVQKKAAKASEDFADKGQALDALERRFGALKESILGQGQETAEEAIGGFLFETVNLSRFLRINAENSLTNTTNQFINRFEGVEQRADESGRSLHRMSAEELEALWGRKR